MEKDSFKDGPKDIADSPGACVHYLKVISLVLAFILAGIYVFYKIFISPQN